MGPGPPVGWQATALAAGYAPAPTACRHFYEGQLLLQC